MEEFEKMIWAEEIRAKTAQAEQEQIKKDIKMLKEEMGYHRLRMANMRKELDAEKEGNFLRNFMCMVALVVAVAMMGIVLLPMNTKAAAIAGVSKTMESILEDPKPVEVTPTFEVKDDTVYINGEKTYDSYQLLVACVEAEAADEPFEGKRMVADVILNRVDTKGYPDTVYGVVTQPYRFTSYWNGAIDWRLNIGIQEETYEAVNMELIERGYPGLLHFQEGSYSPYGTAWRKVGSHYFST